MDSVHVGLLGVTGVLAFLVGVQVGRDRERRTFVPAYRNLFRFAALQSEVMEQHGITPEEFRREVERIESRRAVP